MEPERMGNGQWAMGDGQWAMGNGRWAMGNGRWANSNPPSAPLAAEGQDVGPHKHFQMEDFAMPTDATVTPNVKQAVPFFMVTDIEASLRFYVDGLGFAVTNEWRPERAGGRIQWCWLQLGDASLMLQEYWRDGRPGGAPEGPLGQGVSVCLMCADATAIYRELAARGVAAGRPFVGNGLWVTAVKDPDGYHLYFESPTDVPEETVYSG